MSILDDNIIKNTDIKYQGFPKSTDIIGIDYFYTFIIYGYKWINPIYFNNQIFINGLGIGIMKSPWPISKPYSIIMLYKDNYSWELFAFITGDDAHYDTEKHAYEAAYKILLSIQENPKLLHLNKKEAQINGVNLSYFK